MINSLEKTQTSSIDKTSWPRLLLISAVLPVKRSSGQQMRVYNKLVAFAEHFHVTFLGIAPQNQVAAVEAEMADMVDETIILPRKMLQSKASRVTVPLWCQAKALRSGLLRSNHLWKDVELSPERIAAAIDPQAFQLVVYEYWHTHNSIPLFRQHGVPVVLDMHDLLWRVVKQKSPLPQPLKDWRVNIYRRQEEAAWLEYDGLIAINSAEYAYAAERIGKTPIFYAPMGIDTSQLPYQWQPSSPPRIVFFGGMANVGNQASARWCKDRIMPLIWQQRPDCEFWVVGGNPPDDIAAWDAEERIHVTGFVEDLRDILPSMTLTLCPWEGKNGFRSRLMECMSLGVPVVGTADAVHGMRLEENKGLLLSETDQGMADHCLKLLSNHDYATEQSHLASQQVETTFGFDATYGQLARDLVKFLN